jgi:hypothetical protein
MTSIIYYHRLGNNIQNGKIDDVGDEDKLQNDG